MLCVLWLVLLFVWGAISVWLLWGHFCTVGIFSSGSTPDMNHLTFKCRSRGSGYRQQTINKNKKTDSIHWCWSTGETKAEQSVLPAIKERTVHVWVKQRGGQLTSSKMIQLTFLFDKSMREMQTLAYLSSQTVQGKQTVTLEDLHLIYLLWWLEPHMDSSWTLEFIAVDLWLCSWVGKLITSQPTGTLCYCSLSDRVKTLHSPCLTLHTKSLLWDHTNYSFISTHFRAGPTNDGLNINQIQIYEAMKYWWLCHAWLCTAHMDTQDATCEDQSAACTCLNNREKKWRSKWSLLHNHILKSSLSATASQITD